MCNVKQIGHVIVITAATFVAQAGVSAAPHAQLQLLGLAGRGLAADAAITVTRGAIGAELSASARGLAAGIEGETGAAARAASGSGRANTRIGARIGIHPDHSDGHGLALAAPPGGTDDHGAAFHNVAIRHNKTARRVITGTAHSVFP
jgi:hypothetical protein